MFKSWNLTDINQETSYNKIMKYKIKFKILGFLFSIFSDIRIIQLITFFNVVNFQMNYSIRSNHQMENDLWVSLDKFSTKG